MYYWNKKSFVILALTLVFSFIPLSSSLAKKGLSKQDKEIQKTIKILVNAVRYGKGKLAHQQLDYMEMGKIIMGPYWKEMTAVQQKKLAAGIKNINNKSSFPKSKKVFKHLSNIIYQKPRVKKGKKLCKTVIIVYQNYKKKEYVIDFQLKKSKGKWKIIEMYMLGEGSLAGIHQDQVKPLYKKGGIKMIMAKVAEMSKK